jgi:hypothetical protein
MKGRKPENLNVVPLTGVTPDAERFARQGLELANQLKPVSDDPDADMAWDRWAPEFANPLRGRLKAHTALAFEFMCYDIALAQRLRVEIGFAPESGFYTIETRNGMQQKARPQVAQLNQVLARLKTSFAEFGLTPASERAIRNGPAQGMLDLEDDFD